MTATLTQSVTIETHTGEQIEVTEGDVLFYLPVNFRYVCKAIAIQVERYEVLTSEAIFDLFFVCGSRKSFEATCVNKNKTGKLKVEVSRNPRHFEFLFTSEKDALDFFIAENEKIIKERQDILSDAESLAFLPLKTKQHGITEILTNNSIDALLPKEGK